MAVVQLWDVRRFDIMNIIRVKISVFWLLFLLFCLLLFFSWHYRLLWLTFLPILAVIRYTKPQLPRGPRRLGLLFRFGFILCLVSVFLHVYYPFSAAALTAARIACILFTVPLVCYTVYLDYGAFTFAHNRNA